MELDDVQSVTTMVEEVRSEENSAEEAMRTVCDIVGIDDDNDNIFGELGGSIAPKGGAMRGGARVARGAVDTLRDVASQRARVSVLPAS